MLYREMQDNEYMNMENWMTEYETTPQYMPYMGYPMMDGMYNPPTYDPQMTDPKHDMSEYFELTEDLEVTESPDAYMQRSPHSNYSDHDHDDDYDNYHNYNHHDNYGYPSHGYYNPYYQNYYPYYNFNPLLIPLLFGRD